MLGALLLVSTLAQPAETAAERPIIVTGRGLAPGRGESVYDQVLIDRDRLASSPSNRLEDVLRDVPGFQQFRRSDSRSANPTSQGATLRALGGNASARALVLLEGVPQSDPFGGWIGWSAIDPRRLGQIRVVRGGGTGASGPGALAGTIELSSAGPADTHRGQAEAAYGSRDGVDAFFLADTRLGAGYASLSGSWAQGDGFVPVIAAQRGAADRPSPYRQRSLALRGVAPVSDATELQTKLSVFDDRRERGTAFSDIRTSGADASLRLVGGGALPFSLLGYVQLRDFSNQFASLSAGRAAASPVLDQYSVPSTGLGARVELRPKWGDADLRLGADWRDTEGRTQELYQFAAGAFTRRRIAGGRSRTIGGFAEIDWSRGPLTLSAGARIDRWWIEGGRLDEQVIATGQALTATAFPDRAGWEATGRAGVGLSLGEGLSLRAALYRGWRLPTLNELYRPFRVGVDATAANAALEPERMDGAEAGLEWRPAPSLRFGATLFVNRLDEAIANVTLGRGPGLFPGVGFVPAGGDYRQRRNLDRLTSRGVELEANWTQGPWQIRAGYSFADARVKADAEAAALNGLRPAQAPRHSASTTIAWSPAVGPQASLSLRYVGAQFEDDLNRTRLPDALTLDAFASLPLGAQWALVGRAENLTDARVVAGISGADIIERATPRTLWLGLRWRG